MNFVVIDEVWNGRQVTSPNHPGSIELLVLSKRVDQQFQQKGCSFEDSKALKNLCERITNWHDQTAPESVKYVTGISNLGELVGMFMSMESELEELSEEEAIQLLVKRGIFDEKKLPVLLEGPSLWYTEAAWKYRFPGVEMPSSPRSASFRFNGKEYASFSIFDRSQMEAAKAQMEALNRLGA